VEIRAGILLDRDGTLVDFHRDPELGSVVSAFHPSQLRLLPGVVEGLRLLQDAGFALAIATNQPGAAKGQVPRVAITRTNEALVALLAQHAIRIEAVAVCLHHPEGGPGGEPELRRQCECRKPAPGLLLKLAEDLQLSRSASWMVGDTAADVGAARRAGVRSGLVLDERRCDLCPLRDRPLFDGTTPDRVARRFDLLARAIVDSR
jgi:D-glycero-D-manno-heptose 1,7-bisphosphate phosphatase